MKLFTAIFAFAAAVAAIETIDEYLCVKLAAHFGGLARRKFTSLLNQRAEKRRQIEKVELFYEINQCDQFWRFWSRRALCIETESLRLKLRTELASNNQTVQKWEQYCRRYNN